MANISDADRRRAKKILSESGKTISDADRLWAKKILSESGKTISDADLLRAEKYLKRNDGGMAMSTRNKQKARIF